MTKVFKTASFSTWRDLFGGLEVHLKFNV